MIGAVVEQTWTCIAAECDGVVAEDLVGERTLERSAQFAMRADAEAWARAQEAEGFEASAPIALATRYHGPSDSPSNCWVVHAERQASS